MIPEHTFIEAEDQMEALDKCGYRVGDLFQLTQINITRVPYRKNVFKVEFKVEEIARDDDE